MLNGHRKQLLKCGNVLHENKIRGGFANVVGFAILNKCPKIRVRSQKTKIRNQLHLNCLVTSKDVKLLKEITENIEFGIIEPTFLSWYSRPNPEDRIKKNR